MKIGVNVKEAAELTSMGEKYIRSLIKVGILNPIRLERKLVIPVTQIEEMFVKYAGMSMANEEEMVLAKKHLERKSS